MPVLMRPSRIVRPRKLRRATTYPMGTPTSTDSAVATPDTTMVRNAIAANNSLNSQLPNREDHEDHEDKPNVIVFFVFFDFLRGLLCSGPLSSSLSSMLSSSSSRGSGHVWIHDPVLAFYPSARARRAAPRDCAVSVRTRVRRYLLRGGRLTVDPSRTVRAARVRRAAASLRDFHDRTLRDDAGRDIPPERDH